VAGKIDGQQLWLMLPHIEQGLKLSGGTECAM
jgi:hypothetical protein